MEQLELLSMLGMTMAPASDESIIKSQTAGCNGEEKGGRRGQR